FVVGLDLGELEQAAGAFSGLDKDGVRLLGGPLERAWLLAFVLVGPRRRDESLDLGLGLETEAVGFAHCPLAERFGVGLGLVVDGLGVRRRLDEHGGGLP